MSTIQLDVVSSEDSLFSGQVAFVVIPTEMGEIGVYPKHEPLLGRVRPGVLRIKQDERSEEILLAVFLCAEKRRADFVCAFFWH